MIFCLEASGIGKPRVASSTRGLMISIRAQKTLWGRAAGRCSFPDCRLEVFFEEEASNPAIIGENCHIVAEKDDGPRGDPNVPVDERNSYSNLILLCRNHHKVIDDLENGAKSFPVEKLRDMKLAHEAWVREQLCFAPSTSSKTMRLMPTSSTNGKPAPAYSGLSGAGGLFSRAALRWKLTSVTNFIGCSAGY